MKKKILDFSVMKEEITQNNVLEMAELIAFMELRFQIGYLGKSRTKNVCRPVWRYQAQKRIRLYAQRFLRFSSRRCIVSLRPLKISFP